ncbi:MAG: hypothetical protein ACJAV1_003170 [Paraglaciecola sp.]|jgi:hypothetical protein
MMEVRVELNGGDFTIGSAVRVALPHSEYHKATIVPRDALVLRKSSTFIYPIDSENMAQQVVVKTGIGAGEYIEVFGKIDIVGKIDIEYTVVVRGADGAFFRQSITIGFNHMFAHAVGIKH